MKISLQGQNTIFFDESRHTYTDNLGRSYMSVTKFVSSLFPAFDAVEVSNRIGKRDGTDPVSLREAWKRKGELASRNGTRYHLYAEKYMLQKTGRIKPGSLPDAVEPYDHSVYKQIEYAVNSMTKKWQFFSAEQIVFSPRYMLAGQVDLLMINNPSESPGKIHILDWKSNEKIDSGRGYGSMIKFKHVPDTNFMKYAFQLRIYEAIMRSERLLDTADGCPEFSAALIHIRPGQEKPKFMPVPAMRSEIEAVMADREKSI